MIKAQSDSTCLSPRAERLRRQEHLNKRGSLQSAARLASNQRGVTYSVPSFLDLAPRSGVSDVGTRESKRNSVLVYADRGGQQAVRAGILLPN